ncbi:Hypothetical protein A7982_02361 [Minicystis rosea]|nr:Hypothetical protein A7982_02361 [Minicystis rosea]
MLARGKLARRKLAWLTAAAMAALSSPAAAQDAATLAAARKQFQDAVALATAGDCVRALELFKDVVVVKATAQVRFNMAVCQVKTGDYVAAVGSYRLALAEATPSDAEKIKAALAELEPKIPTITIKRGDGATAADITLDGRVLGGNALGAAFPVNPGPHVIKASALDREPTLLEINLAPSESRTIVITLKRPAPAAGPKAQAPVVVTRPAAPMPAGTPGMRIAGFVVGGIGIAGLAASGVFFGLRQSAIADLDSRCGADRQSCPSSSLATRDRGAMSATLSTATLIGGGAALAIGGTLLGLSYRKKPDAPRVDLALLPGGVSVGGSF